MQEMCAENHNHQRLTNEQVSLWNQAWHCVERQVPALLRYYPNTNTSSSSTTESERAAPESKRNACSHHRAGPLEFRGELQPVPPRASLSPCLATSSAEVPPSGKFVEIFSAFFVRLSLNSLASL